MRWQGTIGYSATVMRVSTILAGKQGIILGVNPTLLTESSLYGSSEKLDLQQCPRTVCSYELLKNIRIVIPCMAGLFFPGGSTQCDWEFIMLAYEGRVYPLNAQRSRYIYPVYEAYDILNAFVS